MKEGSPGESLTDGTGLKTPGERGETAQPVCLEGSLVSGLDLGPTQQVLNGYCLPVSTYEDRATACWLRLSGAVGMNSFNSAMSGRGA